MPRIVRFYETGGPEKLKLEDAASQQPGPGEVRLKVAAVGMNRAESMFFHGQYLEEPKLPSRIGYEAAGVVDAVGEGVDAQWVGKKVATVPGFSMNRYGVLGDEAIVPVEVLGEYPAHLSVVEAAAIWMQYVTAWGALMHFGNLTKGDFVVIPAASSSVGLAAIQIVKAEGGISIATTRGSSKREALLAEGADYVIATEEEDLVARIMEITGGKGARLVFDPVAGPLVEKLAQATAAGGIIFEYGALSMQPTPFPLFTCLSNGIAVRGYTLGEIRTNPELLKQAKHYISERLSDKRFHPRIAKTFPLEQVVEAYQYLESNAQVGKLVITI